MKHGVDRDFVDMPCKVHGMPVFDFLQLAGKLRSCACGHGGFMASDAIG